LRNIDALPSLAASAVDIGDYHAGAFGHQALGDGATEAGCTTCNDRKPAGHGWPRKGSKCSFLKKRTKKPLLIGIRDPIGR
jgi:hypothetical protein